MTTTKNDLTNVRSSIVFELFLRINVVFVLAWIIVESLSFVYKNETIIYPSQEALAGEVILMLSVFFVDLCRLQLGSISNRTENIPLCLLTIVLTVATFFGYLYFIQWQLFVIRAELIINIIVLSLTGIGIFFLIPCIIFFAQSSPVSKLYRKTPYQTVS
jgi:hypothetical protein